MPSHAQQPLACSSSRLARHALAQAYDQHLNMILGDVEETITTVEIDDETYEEIIKVRRWAWVGALSSWWCSQEEERKLVIGGRQGWRAPQTWLR